MTNTQTIKIGPDFSMKIPFTMTFKEEPYQDLFWRIDRCEENKDCLIYSDIKVFKVEDEKTFMFLIIKARRKKDIEKKCQLVMANVDYSMKPNGLEDIDEKDTNIINFEIDEIAYSKYFADNNEEEEITSEDSE